MRDGERFFAQGKANANFELAQQQMKRAADWRIGLRRRILAQLAMLGRDSQVFQQRVNRWGANKRNRLTTDSWDLGWRYAPGGPTSVTGWQAMTGRLGDLEPERVNLNTVDSADLWNGVLARDSMSRFDSDNLGGGVPGPSGGNQADFDSLVELISSTVTPDSWDNNGGAGLIAPSSSNLSLVVSQTQEIHGGDVDFLGAWGVDFDPTRVPQGSIAIDSYLGKLGPSNDGLPLISDVVRIYGMNQGDRPRSDRSICVPDVV